MYSTKSPYFLSLSYDDLNRLTLSSTTQASSTPFIQIYAYSLIGNITNKSDVGSYTYAGTNYANPHAPTSIQGVSLSYDNNGNLLSYGTKPYLWNYRNQMTQAGNGTATSTFSYDHEGSRVTKSESGNTTIFPNRYFTSTGTTTTKNIFAGDLLIASVTGGVSGGGNISLTSTSSAVQLGYTSGPTTKNWTHTVSGTNPTLVLSASIFQDVAGVGSITSATYNGLSLTKASSTRTGTKSTEMWYLTNPTTGGNTLSVTVTGATDDIKLLASSWSGAMQSSPIDVKSSTNGSSGNPSVSLTTLIPNDLVLTTLTRHSTTDATTSATPLYKDRTSSILSATSYQLAQSPGLYTDTYTGPENHNWSMIMLAIKPSSGGGGTGSTTTHYIHTDHLGGTNVVTDPGGNVVQTLDYYPFGSERISTGSNTTDRHYIGERYDSSTELNYLNARYYRSAQGQFLSQDPTHLAIGDSAKLTQLNNQQQKQLLADPQSLNSYSYARGNPIVNKDPTGLCFEPLTALACVYGAYTVATLSIDVYDVYQTNVKYAETFSSEEKNRTNFRFGLDLALTATGMKLGRDVGLAADVGFSSLTATLDVLDTYFGEQIYKKNNENRDQNKKQQLMMQGASKSSANVGGTSNVQTNSAASRHSSAQGGASYNQLMSGLSSLVSSLKAYVSNLQTSKDKKR